VKRKKKEREHPGLRKGNRCICQCVYCERGECENCDGTVSDFDPHTGAHY